MPQNTDSAPDQSDVHLDISSRYLSLLKEHLLRGQYAKPELGRRDKRRLVYRPLQRVLRRFGMELVRPVSPDEVNDGRMCSTEAETMIGRVRLDHLEDCVTDVIRNDVAGDLIEAGVWRGGASILMRAVLDVHGDSTRTVWVADSFRGLPKPRPDVYPADEGDKHWSVSTLAVPLETVKSNFARYGVLDSRVRFVEGWFSKTLHRAPIERLAILRMDGDMYESTMDILQALYHKVEPGGYVIVDDYGAVNACRKAVTDFRDQRRISEPVNSIDWTGVYWQKLAI